MIDFEFHYAIPYMFMIYSGIAFHFPICMRIGSNYGHKRNSQCQWLNDTDRQVEEHVKLFRSTLFLD